MSPRHIPLNALWLTSVLSGAVKADDLWTSALSIDGGTDLQCRITNVTSRRQLVQAESYREDGTVVSRSGNVILIPHGSAVLTNDDSATGAIACRFNVKHRSAVRASAQNTQDGRGAIAVMPAQ